MKVAENLPDRIQLVGMSAHNNAQSLAAAANRFKPPALCIGDDAGAAILRQHLKYQPQIFVGAEGLIQLATQEEADMVLVAIIGTGGLKPALAAIEAGKDLAVASKEILVMAGEIMMTNAKKRGIQVLPVDSEHNAIFQCLEGKPPEHIHHLILTASGGPFRTLPKEKLAFVTPDQALKHPTWNMGTKITIDSATLFNKGLEMIEAQWLFGVPMSKVEVVVHPQSIVHSLVEFIDGSILAQLSHSDMCFPIQYAVTWPDRVPNPLPPLKLHEIKELKFEEPRYEDFPAIGLAKTAGTQSGTLPTILNASNEIAVEAFLNGKIRFNQIWEWVARAMDRVRHLAQPSLDDILRSDHETREFVKNALENCH
jgi:1-deoxy-D-xylulose-5-phosphate reductoisomerase